MWLVVCVCVGLHVGMAAVCVCVVLHVGMWLAACRVCLCYVALKSGCAAALQMRFENTLKG